MMTRLKEKQSHFRKKRKKEAKTLWNNKPEFNLFMLKIMISTAAATEN